MNIDFTITGKYVKEKAAALAKGGAFYLEVAIRNTVNNGSRTGIEYPLGPSGRMVRASAPGEPPAKRTGNLINNSNLRTEKVSDTHYNVVLTAEYAKYLEYGTFKMAPRPYIAPNIEKAKEYINSKKGG